MFYRKLILKIFKSFVLQLVGFVFFSWDFQQFSLDSRRCAINQSLKTQKKNYFFLQMYRFLRKVWTKWMRASFTVENSNLNVAHDDLSVPYIETHRTEHHRLTHIRIQHVLCLCRYQVVYAAIGKHHAEYTFIQSFGFAQFSFAWGVVSCVRCTLGGWSWAMVRWLTHPNDWITKKKSSKSWNFGLAAE